MQIRGIAAAHVRDGAAMVKFLRWLEKAVPRGGQTEITASDRLRAFREEQPLFQDLSFSTISGYAAHGAIVHYSATPQTDAPLKPKGVYLIDSGAQYLDGTTDITRTVALGPPTPRAKRMFTRVLQGNINLTRTPVPARHVRPAPGGARPPAADARRRQLRPRHRATAWATISASTRARWVSRPAT